MRRISALLLLTASLPSTGRALESLPVDEIISRNLAARGGYDDIKAVRTLVYSGGLYEEGDYTGAGDATMAFARPYYRVVGNPDEPDGYMEGYDGGAWEWFAEPGIVVRTVGAAAGATRRGADFEGPLIDYRAKGSTIVLGEPDTIRGRPAYRLVVTLRDGFVREYFVDQESFLVVAERRSAPIHAFGDPVTSETRIGDYRPAAGSDVLFARSYVETDLGTGEVLSRMQWGKIEANRDLPASWFSPPEFERNELQHFLERLYGERNDKEAVLWTYHEFRRAHPSIDTREGIEVIGYQMLKMGDAETAVALLEASAAHYPDSSTTAFGLGRAFATGGDKGRARESFERALQIDPENQRARRALERLAADPVPAANPLNFLQPFIGSWGFDPEGEIVKKNPAMASDIALQLEWADPARKILRFFEGIPGGERDRRILENFVTFNSRSEEVVALGYQLRNDFLYESTFQPQEDGFIRDYKVTYPPSQEFRNDQDRERGWIRYRDRCHLLDPDRLRCVTEQMRDGEWQPWGSAEGFVMVRR